MAFTYKVKKNNNSVMQGNVMYKLNSLKDV